MRATVGRIVHYYSPGRGLDENMTPQAAIVIAVEGETVHLQLFPLWVDAPAEPGREVARWAQNGTDPAIHGPYWTWPPRDM